MRFIVTKETFEDPERVAERMEAHLQVFYHDPMISVEVEADERLKDLMTTPTVLDQARQLDEVQVLVVAVEHFLNLEMYGATMAEIYAAKAAMASALGALKGE